MSKEATVNALKYTLEHFKKHSMMAISCNDYFTTMLEDALKLIESQPDVVRCKDCENAQRMCQPWNDLVCEKNGIVNRPDFFCADGKRKDGQ